MSKRISQRQAESIRRQIRTFGPELMAEYYHVSRSRIRAWARGGGTVTPEIAQAISFARRQFYQPYPHNERLNRQVVPFAQYIARNGDTEALAIQTDKMRAILIMLDAERKIAAFMDYAADGSAQPKESVPVGYLRGMIRELPMDDPLREELIELIGTRAPGEMAYAIKRILWLLIGIKKGILGGLGLDENAPETYVHYFSR